MRESRALFSDQRDPVALAGSPNNASRLPSPGAARHVRALLSSHSDTAAPRRAHGPRKALAPAHHHEHEATAGQRGRLDV